MTLISLSLFPNHHHHHYAHSPAAEDPQTQKINEEGTSVGN